MTTDKYIKSYAVIKSRWVSENLLDAYLPFIVTIIKENNMVDIDEGILCKEIKIKYDLSLQPTVIRQVLSHAMSKNIITKVREQYVVNKSQLKQFVIPEDDFECLWESLITDFVDYATSLTISLDRNETADNIVKFIDVYDDHIIYNSIGDMDVENNQFIYAWCKYILHIKNSNAEKYEFVLALCTANLMKNTLFYTSNEKQASSSLKVYLDTPMIFALLGMDTPERQKSYAYILEKVKQAGMQLYMFDHNFEEATGIMERASRWALSNQYDPSKANKVAQFFHDSNMIEEEISDFISESEATLNSLGIIKDNSSYIAEEHGFQADEDYLHDLIKTEYGAKSQKHTTEELYNNSIRTDVRSLVMIERKRTGGYSFDLKSSRYIFITTNGIIAKVSKDYASKDELSKNKIPTCITADIFGTLLWMEFPEQNENYLSLKMLADCRAILRPTAQMIAQFNLHLDEAYKRGEEGLTEQTFLFLRSHPIVRTKLLDVTSGEYSQFTDHSWRDVYAAIKSHAQYEGEQKYQSEKTDHEKTKGQLQEASKIIDDKDREISQQNTKINNQKKLFSLILARIITIAVFGIPYLASCVVIAILQNEYLKWTLKGIIISSITIIIAGVLGIFYRKTEEFMRNKILQKFE